MKLNCIIVEDEPLALERAKDFVEKISFLHPSATFDNAIDALLFLKNNKVDLMFLDINLGAFSGIQLLETTNLECKVILTTAYHEFAIKGFDLKVSDYLLKPYSFERFVQAVERVLESYTKPISKNEKDYIFVKVEYRLEKILLDDILFIEGMGDYRCIYTPSKKLMTLQTFTELEQAIVPDVICRVHKSFMVALNKIQTIEKDRIKIGEKYIPISETYREIFYKKIN